jgi:histidinol phosphatase-like enzyme
MELIDFEPFDEEKFKDLYNDQFAKLEDTFMELEKIEEIERVELLSQMEDLVLMQNDELLKIEEFEMQELDKFENKMMKELKKDDIILNSNDFKSFRLSEKELKVNGEKQSNKLKEKYIKLYEEITNDKLQGTMSIIFEK